MLIGTLISWALSNALPAWKRRQSTTMVTRLGEAEPQHVRVAPSDIDFTTAKAAWRRACSEVQESLTAADPQHTQFDPRALQSPLEFLERVQARGDRPIAQPGGVRILRKQLKAALSEQTQPLIEAHLAPIWAALEAPSATMPSPWTSPAENLTHAPKPSPHEESAMLNLCLRDAADNARAPGIGLATTQGREANFPQDKQP